MVNAEYKTTLESQRLMAQLWSSIFDHNRFTFDEADTSLSATGVQKGSGQKRLEAVFTEVPHYIDNAISEVLGDVRGAERLEAERSLMILTVRYRDGGTETVRYEDWKSSSEEARERVWEEMVGEIMKKESVDKTIAVQK